MLFGHFLLVLFCTYVQCSSSDDYDKNPAVLRCGSLCSKQYEAACKTGCLSAYTLTHAPKDYAHNPSCEDSCKDAYANAEEQTACQLGCENFKSDLPSVQLLDNSVGSPFSNFLSHCHRKAQEMSERLRSLFMGSSNQEGLSSGNDEESTGGLFDQKMAEMLQRIRSAFANSISEHHEPVDSSADEPYFVTRIRIFFLPKPEEEKTVDTESSQTIDHQKLLDSVIPSKAIEPAQRSDNSLPEHVTVDRWTVRYNVISYLHSVFSSPVNILIIVSLFALLILFIVKVTCLRGSRRSLGHKYARLPTYAEAVEIKIPVDAEEYIFEATDKSKLSTADTQALS